MRNFLAVVACVTCSVAVANSIDRKSFEFNVKVADVVAIGFVYGHTDDKSLGVKYARVEVEKLLKGVATKEILFISRSRLSELDPDCCEIGKRYLFLLEKLPNGSFRSVNGPYGTYRIEK